MSLKITNLNKSYLQGADKLNILKNLNLETKLSEVVAIVGASGSGKSTFLSLVAGLDRFDSGDISINDTSIKNLSSSEMTQFRAKNIGFVFQQFHLVNHLTAFENIQLPMQILNQKISKEQLMQKLDDVGLRERAQHKPTELSGGECQRLAIARGLITKPKLLLADEPSGNLDTETGSKVMNLFFQQVKESKTTCLLVTHDIELAKKCDRILILKDGSLHPLGS